MPLERLSLKDAGDRLDVSPDTIRQRWRKGEIKGERDNNNKIWVFIDSDAEAGRKGNSGRKSKEIHHGNPDISSLDSKLEIGLEINALKDHLQTVKQENATLRAERDKLWTQADEQSRELARLEGLKAEAAGLRERINALSIERASEREHLTQLIEDVRKRLDQAEAERRAKDVQLTELLTAQSAKAETPAAETTQRPAPARGLRAWLRRRTG